MTNNKLSEIINRWDSGEGKPYKGHLIDWNFYGGDGEPPLSCMCAQGQVLHLVGGWGPERLRNARQADADRECARILNISIAHAILLRKVNDKVDGAPSIVLTAPEKVLGDQARVVLAFWIHLDQMTPKQWAAASDASRAAANVNAALDASVAAMDASGSAPTEAATDAVRASASLSLWLNRATSTFGAVRATAYACSEIQGARIMREKDIPFTFLPMFGFAHPGEIPQLPTNYGEPQ